ncbi:Conserved hypothetical protein function [Hexamita inflata]|uniref:Uncharacterized protein n=1 Tax=Hexamita inflata TaxID=28002 RepID=A0AA86Q7M1_9EUKA|nr:Conserved hypothetical protein function [Hexamita inflata]
MQVSRNAVSRSVVSQQSNDMFNPQLINQLKQKYNLNSPKPNTITKYAINSVSELLNKQQSPLFKNQSQQIYNEARIHFNADSSVQTDTNSLVQEDHLNLDQLNLNLFEQQNNNQIKENEPVKQTVADQIWRNSLRNWDNEERENDFRTDFAEETRNNYSWTVDANKTDIGHKSQINKSNESIQRTEQKDFKEQKETNTEKKKQFQDTKFQDRKVKKNNMTEIKENIEQEEKMAKKQLNKINNGQQITNNQKSDRPENDSQNQIINLNKQNTTYNDKQQYKSNMGIDKAENEALIQNHEIYRPKKESQRKSRIKEESYLDMKDYTYNQPNQQTQQQCDYTIEIGDRRKETPLYRSKIMSQKDSLFKVINSSQKDKDWVDQVCKTGKLQSWAIESYGPQQKGTQQGKDYINQHNKKNYSPKQIFQNSSREHNIQQNTQKQNSQSNQQNNAIKAQIISSELNLEEVYDDKLQQELIKWLKGQEIPQFRNGNGIQLQQEVNEDVNIQVSDYKKYTIQDLQLKINYLQLANNAESIFKIQQYNKIVSRIIKVQPVAEPQTKFETEQIENCQNICITNQEIDIKRRQLNISKENDNILSQANPICIYQFDIKQLDLQDMKKTAKQQQNLQKIEADLDNDIEQLIIEQQALSSSALFNTDLPVNQSFENQLSQSNSNDSFVQIPLSYKDALVKDNPNTHNLRSSQQISESNHYSLSEEPQIKLFGLGNQEVEEHYELNEQMDQSIVQSESIKNIEQNTTFNPNLMKSPETENLDTEYPPNTCVLSPQLIEQKAVQMISFKIKQKTPLLIQQDRTSKIEQAPSLKLAERVPSLVPPEQAPSLKLAERVPSLVPPEQAPSLKLAERVPSLVPPEQAPSLKLAERVPSLVPPEQAPSLKLAERVPSLVPPEQAPSLKLAERVPSLVPPEQAPSLKLAERVPSLVPAEQAPSLKLVERVPSINLQNQTNIKQQENNQQYNNVKLSEPEQIKIDVRQEEIQIKMHQKVEAKPVQQAPASFLDSLYGGLMDNTKKKGRRK